MLLVSTGFKKGILGPKGFADLFNGGRIGLFDGPRPGSPDDAQPGPPLGWVTAPALANGGLLFVQSGPYVITRPGDRWRFRADFAGSVIWWRLVGPDDDGSASLDAPRMEGDIGTAAAPAEVTLKQLTFEAGNTLEIDSFLYTIPPLLGT